MAATVSEKTTMATDSNNNCTDNKGMTIKKNKSAIAINLQCERWWQAAMSMATPRDVHTKQSHCQ